MKRKSFILILIALILILNLISLDNIVKAEEDPSKTVGKIIYLTFDDGPAGKVTSGILDILKAEEVPATFFVIGNQIENQEELILRMKNEGHSIGLHSFTHDRNKLYSNNEGFIKEMLAVQERLFQVTDETYCILRFPFGSTNNTYTLSKSMVDLIHQHNFKIYDWTQDTYDGANPNSSPECIYKKSISEKDSIVLLMHCGGINKNSVLALPRIIKYYKEKGYQFMKITTETPELYKLK